VGLPPASPAASSSLLCRQGSSGHRGHAARRGSALWGRNERWPRRPGPSFELRSGGADERTRTSTSVSSRRPERRASTNSATSAGAVNLSVRRRRPASTDVRARMAAAPGRRSAPLLPWQPVAPLSSRGLGRRPLTAETGVRIPVAVSDWSCEHGTFPSVLVAPSRGARCTQGHQADHVRPPHALIPSPFNAAVRGRSRDPSRDVGRASRPVSACAVTAGVRHGAVRERQNQIREHAGEALAVLVSGRRRWALARSRGRMLGRPGRGRRI
jgi:hypothetical protein